MGKYILIVFLVIIPGTILAQEIVSTQGETYTNAGSIIDFTIGEVVIFTGTDGNNDITQGFHQTKWSIVGLDDLAPEYNISVFPNPCEDKITIRVPSFEGISYTMCDVSGKIITKNKLSGETSAVDVSNIAAGNYLLTLKDKNQQRIKTFTLVKTN